MRFSLLTLRLFITGSFNHLISSRLFTDLYNSYYNANFDVNYNSAFNSNTIDDFNANHQTSAYTTLILNKQLDFESQGVLSSSDESEGIDVNETIVSIDGSASCNPIESVQFLKSQLF